MKNKEKWFKPGKSLNWSKDASLSCRRRSALKSRQGNALRTARALQAVSNVTKDKATKIAAAVDARYFYKIHAKKSK